MSRGSAGVNINQPSLNELLGRIRSRPPSTAILILGALLGTLVPATAPAEGQILRKLRRTVERAAEEETLDRVDRLTRKSVGCVFDDLDCIRRVTESGEPVVLTDPSGEAVLDDEGNPISDPSMAAETVAERTPRPGEGAWANYDFLPGDRVLFAEDFSKDRVGDFPRSMEFVKGNWEIIEWNGRRLLRTTGPRDATVRIPLPETLPESFTVELEVFLPHRTQRVALFTEETPGLGNYTGQYFGIAGTHATGVKGRGDNTVESASKDQRIHEALTSIRFMVDGQYVKAYVNERRVANAPNVNLVRNDMIQIQNLYDASEEEAILIGGIRIAAGGLDLYDVLSTEGRVATRGITFAVNSDRIRPESTGTLREMGLMLEEHPDLRLSIEGHTDSDGDDALNLELSERRAASVKQHLVDTFGIDASRLETAGFGETVPMAENDTSEGKAENRRVELVRMEPVA